MTLRQDELEYLSAWGREEWEPACYQLPAHRLQLAHGVTGSELIALIKAWSQALKKKDQEILTAGSNADPPWPWTTLQEFQSRVAQAEGKNDLHAHSAAK
ncbi:MAG: hypothetical protein U0793_23125 [Gemmataceae bacterium]